MAYRPLNADQQPASRVNSSSHFCWFSARRRWKGVSQVPKKMLAFVASDHVTQFSDSQFELSRRSRQQAYFVYVDRLLKILRHY
jgi:hypothetical protein